MMMLGVTVACYRRYNTLKITEDIKPEVEIQKVDKFLKQASRTASRTSIHFAL